MPIDAFQIIPTGELSGLAVMHGGRLVGMTSDHPTTRVSCRP